MNSSETFKELLALCVCLGLRKTSRRVTRMYDDALRPIGLRSTQLPILVALSLARSLPMSTLADQLEMDRTTLTRNLRPLAKRGLVEIVGGQDKRTRKVRLTLLGQEIADRAVPLWEKAQRYALEALGSDRLQELHDTMSELLSLADRGREGVL